MSAEIASRPSHQRANSDEHHAPVQHQPVAPYIPLDRAHPSDAFTGYSEPVSRGTVAIRGLYSSTQFDTLSVLSRVYTRPNPKIVLGPVDDSVSFVVVDGHQNDFPIVYCSENFRKLTGYTRDEIVGRNCRFLQYPPPDTKTGEVVRPIERSEAVEAFKRSLMLGQECQASIMNYRRDGEAFLNLISVVPIRWKDETTGKDMEYYVGFQVDLGRALGGENSEEPHSPTYPDHSSIPLDPTDRAIKSFGPGDEAWAQT